MQRCVQNGLRILLLESDSRWYGDKMYIFIQQNIFEISKFEQINLKPVRSHIFGQVKGNGFNERA